MIIDRIINMNKIRYDELNLLLNGIKLEPTINLYIDLTEITKQFYQKDVVEEVLTLDFKDLYNIVSSIINIAAHYRRYFRNRKRKECNIFFTYMNRPPVLNRTFLPQYGDNIIERYKSPDYVTLNNMLREVIKLVGVTCRMIPGTYLLLSEGVDNAMLPFVTLENSFEKKVKNLIITRNELPFQFVSPDTFIIKHSKGGCSIVNQFNIFNIITKKVKYTPKTIITADYLPLYFALCGMKQRSISSIKGVGSVKIIKLLEKYVSQGLNPLMTMMSICDELGIEDKSEIERRISAFDFKSLVKNLDKTNYYKFLVDDYDLVQIDALNGQHFSNNPLDLFSLLPNYYI